MRVCPVCGGSGIETTTMGFVSGPDRNRASCPCGWKGFAYELVQAMNGEFLFFDESTPFEPNQLHKCYPHPIIIPQPLYDELERLMRVGDR